MMRKTRFIYALVVAVLCSGYFSHLASANSTITATFISANYDEVQVDKDRTEKRLKSITIRNERGQQTTLNIDKYAKLFVDTVSTTIDAFKYGMEVEVDVNLRNVKMMRGSTGTTPAQIDKRDRTVTGTVNRIDPSGEYLSIRLDNGQTNTYYINAQTEFFKGTTLKDMSVLYEGDRVKLTFGTYNTNFIQSVEVNVQGVQVEGLYKGTIQRIEPTTSKVILKDEKKFLDWRWQSNTQLGPNGQSNSSYNYSKKTPIYIGDKRVTADKLRYYADHDVYFATVRQGGTEVIEKMIIKEKYERTFFEPLSSINPNAQSISLQTKQAIPYHAGTIMIRNGRLVDELSLQSGGTAFIVTDSNQNKEFASVIHIANDGFQSPNLTHHGIYFGQIYAANNYELTLGNAMQLGKNNYWQFESMPTFTFSNDTVAVRDFRQSVLTIIPQQDELKMYTGRYGYFYVENNQVVSVHLIEPTASTATLISVGRIDNITTGKTAIIRVRNVSQWQNGSWKTAGNISSMDIEQATIIKEGKVISAKDLRVNDRVYLLHESQVKGRVLLVD